MTQKVNKMTLLDIIVFPMFVVICCCGILTAISTAIALLVLPLMPFALALEAFEKVKRRIEKN